MPTSLLDLIGYTTEAQEGTVGKIHNFFFDEDTWWIRYFVVETGGWLRSRRVLISPEFLGAPDPVERAIAVCLTKEQVRSSPDVDTEKPISRQCELAVERHFRWRESILASLPVPKDEVEEAVTEQTENDTRLRSINEVRGYQVNATDGKFGFIADFIVDEEDWRIQGIAIVRDSRIRTSRIQLPTKWVKSISWADQRVGLGLTRGLRILPEFGPLADSSHPSSPTVRPTGVRHGT